MSSLVPGQIFISSGLNRNSTPTPPSTTPAQLDERYKRVDFNGHDWPKESPIARAYDVANTSTKLIILNNKYGKGSTRLRGYYTGPKRPERHIDPNRHRAPSPRNPRFHTACYDSSSPKFEPPVKTELEWINSSNRSPNALTAHNTVNARRHAGCMSSPEIPIHDQRPRSRTSLPPNKYFKSEYADMSMGEKIYMWSIEKIYSMDKMKQLKQEQYKKLLEMEAKKGYHGYQEYVKYMRYINSAKDRSHGTGSTSRSRSAYSPRSMRSRSATSRTSPTKSEKRSEEDMDKENDEKPERPKTSLGHARREPLNDSKTSDNETKKRESSAGSNSQRGQSSASSPRGKSPTRSSGTGSQRSLRSKSESRASSAVSAKKEEKPKGGHSDSSLTTDEEGDPPLHKEGKDRPKSRLGHPGIEDHDQAAAEGTGSHIHTEGKDRPKSRLGHPHSNDTDKDSLASSTLSIKSDSTNHTGDSGVGNSYTGRKTPKNNVSKTKSNTENRQQQGNNRTKRKKDKLGQSQSMNVKQAKKMGSRSSVNSKSSSKNEKDNTTAATERNDKFEKDEEIDKSIDKDTKVHRIPSATPNQNKASTTDEENDTSSEMNSDRKVENVDTNKQEENTRSVNKGEENDFFQKTVEERNVTDEAKQSEIEIKADKESSNVESESKISGSKDSEQENKNTNSDAEAALTKSEPAREDLQPTSPDKDTEYQAKNKISKQDSFEEEDEDRKITKDPDMIEY